MREILPELRRRQVDSVTRFFEAWQKRTSLGAANPLMLWFYPYSLYPDESG